MPNAFWVIENDPPPNPGRGNALNGLQIQAVYSGTPPVITGYQLMNGSSQLKFYSGTQMPVLFNDVQIGPMDFYITANVPTPGVNGTGHWEVDPSARHPENTGDNGDFQAQAGTGIDPETASSANA